MSEKTEFHFDISQSPKEKSILVKIYGGGETPNQPQILLDLLEKLESQEKISPLRREFSQYAEVLESLEMEMAQGKVIVIKEEKSELYYTQAEGYSIRVRVELPADSQEKE